jgi:uncharacterized SAM-binding protein YcdF (DUF218 family)
MPAIACSARNNGPTMTEFDTFAALLRDFLLPPRGLFLLAFAGLFIRQRWRRAGNLCLTLSLVTLALLSSAAFSRLLVAPLEAQTKALSNPSKAYAQAIVVIAAGRFADAPEYGGTDEPDYVTLARLRYAAHLHRLTGLPLLVSGGIANAEGAHESLAACMARALQHDFGVHVTWVETQSETTAMNASESARLLSRDNVRRILLVTDAMHMPRASYVFKQRGLEVVEAPTVFLGRAPLTIGQVLPSAEGMRRSYYALYEWLGLLWYRIR